MQQQASGGTLGRIITSAIARFPDREVLSDGKVHWTYAQLGSTIGQLMTVFRALGLGKGSGIAVLSTNRAEVWAIMCSAHLMGIRYTPMHPLSAEDDHVHIVDDAQVDMLIVDGAAFGARGRAIRARLPELRQILSLGPVEGMEDLLPHVERAASAPLIDESDGEDIAWLCYTGGTTGRSKGVMLSNRALVTATTIMLAEWEWPPLVRYLAVTPISHAAGVNLYPVMAKGGFARLTSGFEIEKFCTTIEKEKLNTFFLVPTIINTLIDADAVRERYDLSSIDMIIYGAAPMSPDRLKRGIEVFGQVFVQLYGQTECPQVAASLRKIDHDLLKPDQLGSCGRPSAVIDLKLLDSEMREVGVGEPGEICVRGPLVMSGYWQQPEMTAAAFAGDWLHTGDVAIRDAAGFLHIVDRVKDMIISGGFNIYPREVEDALMSHPAVSLAAVIGVPDSKWGEAVKAFVALVPGSDASGEALCAHVKEKRGAPWSPKSVEFLQEIPLTGLGKIDRKRLREPFWKDRMRAVS